MRIVFKPIPKLAIIFYLLGFGMITLAMLLIFVWPSEIEMVRLSQLFIAGAIIVAIGSVINYLAQFKTDRNNHRRENRRLFRRKK